MSETEIVVLFYVWVQGVIGTHGFVRTRFEPGGPFERLALWSCCSLFWIPILLIMLGEAVHKTKP